MSAVTCRSAAHLNFTGAVLEFTLGIGLVTGAAGVLANRLRVKFSAQVHNDNFP